MSLIGECLGLRGSRIDGELVRDEVEEELIKEVALCSEIRDIFFRTLNDVEKQLLENKTAKQRLEFDWSDKKTAHEIDSISMALNNRSTVLMFKPGAVCFPDEQSTPEYWEHFTKENLLEGNIILAMPCPRSIFHVNLSCFTPKEKLRDRDRSL